MATTIPQPLKPGASPDLQRVYDAYVGALGDSDKASDSESAAYYDGLSDAYYDVLRRFDAIEPHPDEIEV